MRTLWATFRRLDTPEFVILCFIVFLGVLVCRDLNELLGTEADFRTLPVLKIVACMGLCVPHTNLVLCDNPVMRIQVKLGPNFSIKQLEKRNQTDMQSNLLIWIIA